MQTRPARIGVLAKFVEQKGVAKKMASLFGQSGIEVRFLVRIVVDDFVRFGMSDGQVRGAVRAEAAGCDPGRNGRSERFAGTGIEVGRFDRFNHRLLRQFVLSSANRTPRDHAVTKISHTTQKVRTILAAPSCLCSSISNAR